MNMSTTKVVGQASAVAHALELLGIKRTEPRRPGEFTAFEFAIETGFNESKARRLLAAACKDGTFTRRSIPIDGASTFLYSSVTVAKEVRKG